MKKLTTFFEKDPNDLGRVIDKVRECNLWVFDEGTKATRKFDGAACAIIEGELYKRYDAKIDKKTGEYKKGIPVGAISCQEADLITGHHPHWVKCRNDNPADKYFFEGWNSLIESCPLPDDGTYELIGEKVNGNKEKLRGHHLTKHGNYILEIKSISFDEIKFYLQNNDMEGIVFHGKNDEMCKIRKSDFGIKR